MAPPSGDSLIETHGFAHPVRNIAALGVDTGMKIADFGSGSGAYVLGLADALHGSGVVYAIDIQKDLLRRTKNEADKRGFKNVEVLWGDLEKPHGSKLADGLLELVLISNLLFQIDDRRAVLREAWRILRPAARLAILDWSDSFGRADSVGSREGVGEREFPVSEGSEQRERRKTEGFRGGWGPQKEDVVPKKEIQGLAGEVGFELIEEFPAGAHHYGLLFRKTDTKKLRVKVS